MPCGPAWCGGRILTQIGIVERVSPITRRIPVCRGLLTTVGPVRAICSDAGWCVCGFHLGRSDNGESERRHRVALIQQRRQHALGEKIAVGRDSSGRIQSDACRKDLIRVTWSFLVGSKARAARLMSASSTKAACRLRGGREHIGLGLTLAMAKAVPWAGVATGIGRPPARPCRCRSPSP